MNQPVKTENKTWTVTKNPEPVKPETQEEIIQRLTKLVTGERKEPTDEV